MPNPPHLGELIGESMDEVGWHVTELGARLGCERGMLSRLLNGKALVSANMALALGGHWLEHRRSLDADAREPRACAGSPRPGRWSAARGRIAHMISYRIRAGGRGIVPDSALRLNGPLLVSTWRRAGGRD